MHCAVSTFQMRRLLSRDPEHSWLLPMIKRCNTVYVYIIIIIIIIIHTSAVHYEYLQYKFYFID